MLQKRHHNQLIAKVSNHESIEENYQKVDTKNQLDNFCFIIFL